MNTVLTLRARPTGPFADSRVILLGKNDPRGQHRHSDCWYSQDHDGPTYVTIGAAASDRQLERLSARFNLPLNTLQQFRADQEGVSTAGEARVFMKARPRQTGAAQYYVALGEDGRLIEGSRLSENFDRVGDAFAELGRLAAEHPNAGVFVAGN